MPRLRPLSPVSPSDLLPFSVPSSPAGRLLHYVASLQVSWLRDTFPIPMLLALNNLTNIADERFAAFHVPGTERFSLRLARARVDDSGFYECQVATRENEPSLFRLIYLEVVSE